ncbi:MAG: aminodeoxychorismate/anthranilate synthase component II [Chitinophagaceae bacterium]|nr:aminodeoxychorismate/anthranilate synthase component II [Chitinophagaceae bacterium]
MKILLIDNYDSFTFNIVEHLRQLQQHDLTVLKNDEVSPEQARTYDRLILSPGPATPSESGYLLDVIRALSATHPILGICLGHQAIAQAFGGTLLQLTHPHHGYRTTFHRKVPDPLFEGLPESFTVGLYHSWVVDDARLPPDLLATGYSADGHLLSLRHQVYPVYGIQFHPESYMTEYGREVLRNFLEV